MAGGRRAYLRTSKGNDEAVDVGHLRTAALAALATASSEVAIDLRDVEDKIEAVRALHDVQDAARACHCRLVIELPKLTIQLD